MMVSPDDVDDGVFAEQESIMFHLDQMRPLIDEFIEAGRECGFLCFAAATAHHPRDSGWPTVVTGDGSSSHGIPEYMWKDMLYSNRRALLPMEDGIWIEVDGQLWEGIFFHQAADWNEEDAIEATRSEIDEPRFGRALKRFRELGRQAAAFFPRPIPTMYPAENDVRCCRDEYARWLETICESPSIEADLQHPAVLKRVPGNIFAASARILREMALSHPLVNIEKSMPDDALESTGRLESLFRAAAGKYPWLYHIYVFPDNQDADLPHSGQAIRKAMGRRLAEDQTVQVVDFDVDAPGGYSAASVWYVRGDISDDLKQSALELIWCLAREAQKRFNFRLKGYRGRRRESRVAALSVESGGLISYVVHDAYPEDWFDHVHATIAPPEFQHTVIENDGGLTYYRVSEIPTDVFHASLLALDYLNPAEVRILDKGEQNVDLSDQTENEDSKRGLLTNENTRPNVIVTAGAKHSTDFRSVSWFGKSFTFSTLQAACVMVLWQNWQQGTPVISEATILDGAGSAGNRLRDVFDKGNHPAWGAMIKAGGKGAIESAGINRFGVRNERVLRGRPSQSLRPRTIRR